MLENGWLMMQEEREQRQADWLDSRPKCDECGDPIQDEVYYVIGFDKVCENCLDNNHKRYVEED